MLPHNFEQIFMWAVWVEYEERRQDGEEDVLQKKVNTILRWINVENAGAAAAAGYINVPQVKILATEAITYFDTYFSTHSS
jgi:hypothetical protein